MRDFGTIFTTLHFLRNLRICPISLSIKLQETENAFKEETLELIGPIRKLRKKMKCCENAPWALYHKTYYVRNLRFP